MRQTMIAWVLGRFVGLTGALALACYVLIQAVPLADQPLRSDGYSYYIYLPSWFIYGDPTLEAPARDCCGGHYPAFALMSRSESTGRWVNAHPIGEALLVAPFFAVAHALTRWSNLPADGFSLYYQDAAALAGIAALLAGLAALRRLLGEHFSEGATLASLVTITWGTNLFHYATYDATYSHVFSFFAISMLILISDHWWQRPTLWRAVGVGAIGGLVVLVRLPNLPYLGLVPLCGLFADRPLVDQVRELWCRRAHLLLMAAACGAAVFPQLLIYRQATGHWVMSAYSHVGTFAFASPQIGDTLFGVERGLFFWSPALLMAIAGTAVSSGWSRRWLTAAIVVVAVEAYIIASWADFGGGFGHRGFTDGLALAAVFIAAFFSWAADRPPLRIAVTTATVACVTLSVVQMMQYWLGVLPITGLTWARYRELFLHFR